MKVPVRELTVVSEQVLLGVCITVERTLGNRLKSQSCVTRQSQNYLSSVYIGEGILYVWEGWKSVLILTCGRSSVTGSAVPVVETQGSGAVYQ